MAVKKKGLGRGLTALLGNSDVDAMIKPKNDDELKACNSAMETCPVDAIGDNG